MIYSTGDEKQQTEGEILCATRPISQDNNPKIFGYAVWGGDPRNPNAKLWPAIIRGDLNNPDNIAVHEIGHILGLEAKNKGDGEKHSADPLALMFKENDGTSRPCKLSKEEWDTINPTP